jgi:hypothetical protein
MYYILTEWNTEGKGEKVLTTQSKKEALACKKHTLTHKTSIFAYYYDYYNNIDVPCSTINTYKNKKAIAKGKPIKIENWY